MAISYAIGVARPVAVTVDAFGTGARSDEPLAALTKGAEGQGGGAKGA